MIIIPLVEQYNRAVEELNYWKQKMYPPDSIVLVDSPQYKGKGKVVPSFDCPVNKLAVLLENDNIWWYPIEMCSPAVYEFENKFAKNKV